MTRPCQRRTSSCSAGRSLSNLKKSTPASKELQNQESSEALGDNFIGRASYYIMANKLIEDRYIDYEKYIQAIAPSIPRSFLQQIIDHIIANDGRVVSITFKSGATHTFTDKTWEKPWPHILRSGPSYAVYVASPQHYTPKSCSIL